MQDREVIFSRADAAASAPDQWRLPFCVGPTDRLRSLLDCSCMPVVGTCCQASDGLTHKDELRYAYDFLLPIGTPVLAARAGEVVAAVDWFGRGGRSKEHKAKANYVALRHAPGLYSRYYHLARASVRVRVGQRVEAGELIGCSGNSGFSSAPHLHFDVCDVLPVETSTFALADGAAFECCAAAFSAELPPPEEPLRAPVVLAEPPTATAPLTNGDAARGAIVVLERCRDVDFIDKVRRAQEAGAAVAVVVNYEAAHVLHTMAYPKLAAPGAGVDVTIPAVMVSRDSGAALRRALDDSAARAGSVDAVLGRSPHLRAREPGAAGWEAAGPESCSAYVARTQPVTFLWPAHPRGYVPDVGRAPPRAVQAASMRPHDPPPGGAYKAAARGRPRRQWLPLSGAGAVTACTSVPLSSTTDHNRNL